MAFQVRLAPKAEQTYTALTEQLYYRWGERFVSKLEIRVAKTIATLSISPYLYPIIDDETGLRRCVLHENCSLIYKVYGDVVTVAYFWDNRQEPFF